VIGFLMDDVKKLEEIGLKEISEKTHIGIKNLEYIANSEFDKLNRSNTVGFIKIISREYNLNFTDWLEEAEQYWKNNRDYTLTPKIFVAEEPKGRSKSILYIVFLIILIAILYGAYIFLNKKLDFFENPLVKKDTNYTYEDTPVVNKAKQALVENNISIGEEIGEENRTLDTIIEEENQSVVKSETENNNSNETNNVVLPKEDNVVLPKEESKIVAEDKNITKTPAPKESSAFILPNSKLWVGIIYLDNNKRKSFLGKEKLELNASRDQLITTGHGNFSMEFNGVMKKFNSQNPIKLLIKDGNFSVISNKKYKELNKGSLW